MSIKSPVLSIYHHQLGVDLIDKISHNGLLGGPMAVKSKQKVEINKKVPDFKLPSSDGGEFKLSGYKGQKLVLFFYPKDSTPGCTVESQQFSKMISKFKKKNTVVFGVSRDSLKSHDNFICKYELKVPLLSDSEEVACKIFDVIKEKNMYGKKVMGIERSTFLIDEDGILVKEWRKVKADGHAEEVFRELD